MSSNQFKESKILIEDNSLDSLLDYFLTKNNLSKIFILTDENTKKYCLSILANFFYNKFDFTSIEIAGGEQNKTIESCIAIWNQLSHAGADKNSLLVNLGGGIITDIGGFVASTYLRGINFINIPTSLMGMADAAIGGKNGIDLNAIKNQIGSINFPDMIFIHSLFLKTLNDRHFKNGLVEVFKHGLIADKKLWLNLSSVEINRDSIGTILTKAIEIKNNIVTEDPYEKGIRKILNFGHTIGHALESCLLNSGEYQLLHGEAIVAGMIMETWLSEKYCGLKLDESSEITSKLFEIFGKKKLSLINFDNFISYLNYDKKNQHQQFNFSLLNAIGSCKWNIAVSLEDVKVVFNRYNATI